MESRIPIPTDNIYKFYALFGLVVFITAAVLKVTTVRDTNELAFQWAPELAALERIDKPTPAEATKRDLIKRRLEIAKKDKENFLELSELLLYVGCGLIILGFSMWQNKVQPKQDKLLDLQLEKAKLELGQMRQVRCSRKRR